MDKKMLKDLQKSDFRRTAEYGITLLCRKKNESANIESLVKLAAMAYVMRKKDFDEPRMLQDFVDKNIQNFVVRGYLLTFINDYWDEIVAYSNSNGKELLASALFYNYSDWREMKTSRGVNTLALKLLDVQEGDTVIDLCSGTGSFLIDAYIQTEAAKLSGVEISTSDFVVSTIRSWLLENALHLYQDNVLTVFSNEYLADKVFSNFPFGVSGIESCLPDIKFSNLLKECSRTDRAGWSFVLAALSRQKPEGRTAVVVNLGMLFRTTTGSVKIRQTLVNDGLLEAVIVLPAGLLGPSTHIPIALMVFSYNNDCVRLIDGSQFGERNFRCPDLSEGEIKKVLLAMKQDSPYSCSVKPDNLQNMDYNLLPNTYLNPISVENGVSLKDLSLSIKRGANIMAKKLDAMSSKDPTPYQYLMLKDIQNGQVSHELTYLADMDAKLENGIIQTGDLLISRNAPFKIAVMPAVGTQQVVANGNLFFLHLDTKKIHPIYAMLYLNSSQGKRQLNSMSKGIVIHGISLKDLEKIEIPMIPMDAQLDIVRKYQVLQEELETAEKQIESIHERMAGLIGGED